jgi:hypothetical protein
MLTFTDGATTPAEAVEDGFLTKKLGEGVLRPSVNSFGNNSWLMT